MTAEVSTLNSALPRLEAAHAVPANAAAADGRAAALIARIEALPFSRWHMRARIVMGSATFLDAFDALSLAFVLPILVGLWHLKPLQIGWLIGASYIGQFVGALLFSRLAETRGRTSSAAIATAIMSVMSLACAAVGGFPALLACRLIQGVGVGGEMPVAAAYISELSRARGRGRFFMLYEMIFPVGLMVTGQVAAFAVPALGWRSLFLIGGLPGLLIAVLIARLPESPRWLIGRGRLDEAETIVAHMEASAHGRNPGQATPPRPSPVPPPPIDAARVQVPQRARWMELLSPVYRMRTLVAWVLWATAFFVANSLNNWLPTLYHTLYGLKLGAALHTAALTNVAQVAVLLVCAFCIDRIGRRKWTIAALIVGAGLMALLAFSRGQPFVFTAAVATIGYGVIGSVAAVLYLYTPEIYPTRMRAVSTGVATSWLRLASAVGPALVGMLLGKGGISGVFLMFCGVAVVGAFASVFMLETQGRALEEIAP
ncbi:MAG: MFS transporter [Caulobacteraceae bacterium]